jgi:probable F420-dependent oxidoreductase
MRWGMTYPLQGVKLSDHREILQQAEDIGYTDAWTAEVDFNDAFTPMAAFSAWTKNTRMGSAIGSIYNRTPTLLAQTAASLEDIAPGRMVFGIGTSSPAIVERWNGVKLEEPLKRMRDTINFMRQALIGEKMVATVGPYDIKGFRMGRPVTTPPIYVAALREQMIRLGASLGDGVITNYISPDDTPRIANIAKEAAQKAGKDPEGVDVAARLFCILTEDRQVAQMIGRYIVSGYLTTPFYYAFHEWLGRGEALSPMMKAWQAGERQQAVGLVPEEVVDELFIFGSPAACKEKIRDYVAQGITTPVLQLIPTERDPAAGAEQCKQALKDLAPG